MAGGQERVLRRRIKSVQSTKKITKAMELIAASRIVKAQARVVAARPYGERITEVIRNLAAAGAGSDSPLLQQRDDISTVCFVVVAADRGLAGGYNAAVIRMGERAILAERAAGRTTRLITVGKKATSYFKFRGYEIDAVFGGFSDNPTYEDARSVAQSVTGRFESGEIDQVRLVYTKFVSVSSQTATDVVYLPIEREAGSSDAPAGPTADYEFEPSPGEILDRLLPRYAEARLYAAFLEAAASELASKQRAMKAATDNAEELITKLSRIMNRARQDSITTEIMEIVSGAEALRQSGGDREDLLLDHIDAHDLFGHQLDSHGHHIR